ncbi:PAS domain S-box-containing protein [Tranquillimonas alkanivorans]|uniref:histidine kinase n=2 Tax=Tranquillimonas alkanivorans TaxID=441119 RepID=A0A1I5WQJ3_9RHOB|nr:PAS domain S-box-containing protein [Tranquillimonas alkanivorans]
MDEPLTQEEAHEQRLFSDAIMRTMRQPLIVLNGDLRVVSANRAFYATFEVSEEETEGVPIYALGNNQWDIPELKRLLENILPNDNEVSDYKVEHAFEQIGRRIMLLNASRMERPDRDDLVLLAIEDITEREDLHRELVGQKELAEKIIDASREALLILDADLKVHAANETFYEFFQVEPSETEGQMVYDLGNGQWDIPALRVLLHNVLPNNNTFNDYEVDHEFKDIGRKTMILNARRVDHLQLILLAIEDQTEARRAAAALRESEEKFRVLVESTSNATWETDPEGRSQGSASWSNFTGQAPEDVRGEGWLEAIHPDDRNRTLREWQQCISRGDRFSMEYRLWSAEHGWRWSKCDASPIHDEDGRIVKWVGMNADISARKEAEEQRELLLGELNHRVKNIFAIIRSLAARSNGHRSSEDFQKAFLGRLDALTSAHSLALESDWRQVDLRRLVEQTMRPYLDGSSESVEVDGPALDLPARPALSLSLVLHELATNALKHGALSVPDGKVRVSWTISETGNIAHFTWRESGGPSASPPQRHGFGTKLVDRVFEYELGGECAVEYRSDGLHLDASFSLG